MAHSHSFSQITAQHRRHSTLFAVPPSEKEEPCDASWQCLLVTPPGVREKGTVRPSDRQAVQGTIGMYRDG